MKCEICHLEEASRAISRVVDGEPKELYVCDACARVSASAPAGGPDGRGLTDVLFSLGMPVPPDRRAADAVCPVCGLSRGDLRARRRLGCPRCFETFETDVRTFLSAQVPAAPRAGEDPDEALRHRAADRLRRELDHAIREERFEDAARLSARLHDLRDPGARRETDG